MAVGLNFFISPKLNSNVDFVNHFLPFEKLAFNLLRYDFYNKTPERESKFNSELKHIAQSSYSEIKHIQPNLSFSYFNALKKSKDKNIVIIKPDKDNGIVCLTNMIILIKLNIYCLIL